jgi:hypothetical protein
MLLGYECGSELLDTTFYENGKIKEILGINNKDERVCRVFWETGKLKINLINGEFIYYLKDGITTAKKKIEVIFNNKILPATMWKNGDYFIFSLRMNKKNGKYCYWKDNIISDNDEDRWDDDGEYYYYEWKKTCDDKDGDMCYKIIQTMKKDNMEYIFIDGHKPMRLFQGDLFYYNKKK